MWLVNIDTTRIIMTEMKLSFVEIISLVSMIITINLPHTLLPQTMMFYNSFRAVHNEGGIEQIQFVCVCACVPEQTLIKKTIIVAWKS